MKKQFYDEKNGMSYTLHGDYYLPDLVLREEEPIYGKYGMLTLIEQMTEKQGVTEELKAQDQMEWVRLMNNIKASAEEIVLKNMIYV